MLGLVSLCLFTIATAGFILSLLKYPRASQLQVWGIRLSYGMGFFGVLAMRIHQGFFGQLSLLIISSLVVSFLAFELSSRRLD